MTGTQFLSPQFLVVGSIFRASQIVSLARGLLPAEQPLTRRPIGAGKPAT
jgi:hypothetical protein